MKSTTATSSSVTRKEIANKYIGRATQLPAELSRYSKNCKLLFTILRDTKLIINEINATDYFAQDDVQNIQISPDKLHIITELVDRSISLVVLGHSNTARAVLANELVGGKPLFPVIENDIENNDEESSHQYHWKTVKIRHTSYCLVGLSTTLPATVSSINPSSSVIPLCDLNVDCKSPQTKDLFSEWSVMDVNLKHFLFRDGTQIWVAPTFHHAENRYNGNWCTLSPSDFISLVNRCTTPIFLYAIKGYQLDQEEKAQLRHFKQLLPSSTVIHFVVNAAHVPVPQEKEVCCVPSKTTSGTRQRRHTSAHPERQSVSFSGSLASCVGLPLTKEYSSAADSMFAIHDQLSELGFLSKDFSGGNSIQSSVGEITCGAVSCLPFVRSVLQNQLLHSAKILNECHNQMLGSFILSAFDWARQVQITPLRLEYVKKKEGELFAKMLIFANKQQEGIREIISQTLIDMRQELIYAAADHQFTHPDDSGVRFDHSRVRQCTEEIQNLVLSILNKAIAEKLTTTILNLREAYLGTLQRCLGSLEKTYQQDYEDSIHTTGQESESETQRASEALKQIINAAYQVQLNVKSSASFAHLLWERLHQFLRSMSPSSPGSRSGSWNMTTSPERRVQSKEWKVHVATELLDSLSESRLARVICSQFRDRLRQSHDAFLRSLRQLESIHTGRLEKNEELFLRLRKILVPRVARLALESTSLKDMILYGMPQLGRELGRGQYGVVYACEGWGPVAKQGIRCAVKSVVPPDDKHWNDLAMEFHYSRMVPEHDRIVSLIGSVIDYSYGGGTSPAVLLVMERLNRDLHTALKMSLTWPKRLRVAIDVTEGIRFLHAQGLVHRDIKLKNVLLDQEDRAKITDLGFCKPEAMMSGSIVGTPIHMAPELFTGQYDSSVDVYAFGILFWYICAGHTKLPYAFEQCLNKDQLWQSVRRGTRPERLPCFDELCWNLMEDCWAGEPTQRPLLGHVHSRLEAIFISHCHGRTIDTGSIVIQREKAPDSVSSSPYVQIDLEPC